MKPDRNPAEWAVLGGLIQAPAHGYDLQQKLSDDLGKLWNLKTSRVYALLGRLEKEGLVSHQKVPQPNRPTKKIHSLTDTGREVFMDWVSKPVEHIRNLRLEFMAKLVFAGRISRQLERDLISAQKLICQEENNRLKKRLSKAENQTDLRILTFRLAMSEAACQWLNKL